MGYEDMTYKCKECGREFEKANVRNQHTRVEHNMGYLKDMEPDWEGKCENCDESPIVPMTGLCGPCTWGEADTVGGNW